MSIWKFSKEVGAKVVSFRVLCYLVGMRRKNITEGLSLFAPCLI